MSFPTAVQKMGLASAILLSTGVAAVTIAATWIRRARADRVEPVRSNTNRHPVTKESAMARDPQKPPHNRDQQHPPRKGDTIEPTIPAERGADKPERNAPLPEEEMYEREPVNRRGGNRQIDG